MALTDHADLKDGEATASLEYISALGRLRQRYPELILIGGVEWNIPPYDGREHVNLLVDPTIESTILQAFREQFDSVGRQPGDDIHSPEEALRWLSSRVTVSGRAALFYNHPSRNVDEDESIGTNFMDRRRATRRVIGLEGGSGHQRSSTIGSYKKKFVTIDRWDPVVATIGGVWDSLLDQG